MSQAPTPSGQPALLLEVVPQPVMTQATHATPTPMLLLQMAMERGDGDLDRLERLMTMQERWQENEARRAFNAAFAAFKAEAVKIVRTKLITDGPLKGKRQAELGPIVQSVTPALSKHGLSLAWRLTKDEKDWMEITCTLRHVDGHAETVSMGGAPDTGPGRNAIQARGSAKTYLERYTALAILGLAPEDDDDGNGGKGGDDQTQLPEPEFQRHLSIIRGAKDNGTLKTVYQSALAACHERDTATRKAFSDEKDRRYRELNPKPAGGGK